MRLVWSWTLLALTTLLSASLGAQEKAYEEPSIKIAFSGVLFANFQYRTDPAARHQNRFDLERAQLTTRAALGERLSARVTFDVFQQQNADDAAFYRGWVIRAKYAYLQYDVIEPRSDDAWSALARIGILHTVMVEHHETFWPRWMGVVAEERFGYFQSADAGAAAELSLPNGLGELYTTITNGPGYTGRETDRFKDFAARFTLTPLASHSSPILKTATLSVWGYKGALASRFVSGGEGQVGAVGSGLRRDRWGMLGGVRDPRLTAVVAYSQRTDESELGDNTLVSPRVVVESTGKLFSTSLLVKPIDLLSPASKTPVRLVGRYDRFEPEGVSGRSRFLVGGVIWDLGRTTSLALDYQEQTSSGGAAAPTTKTWFLHVVVGF